MSLATEIQQEARAGGCRELARAPRHTARRSPAGAVAPPRTLPAHEVQPHGVPSGLLERGAPARPPSNALSCGPTVVPSARRQVRISLDRRLCMRAERGPGVVDFPYAVLEVKLEDENAVPGWVDALVDSGRLIAVEKFSKFLHGAAMLYPRAVRKAPHWLGALADAAAGSAAAVAVVTAGGADAEEGGAGGSGAGGGKKRSAPGGEGSGKKKK